MLLKSLKNYLFSKTITKTEIVNATIIGKKYIPAMPSKIITLYPGYYNNINIMNPEEFWIILKYNNLSIRINNYYIFNNFKERDTIKVLLTKTFNKNNQLINQKISFDINLIN